MYVFTDITKSLILRHDLVDPDCVVRCFHIRSGKAGCQQGRTDPNHCLLSDDGSKKCDFVLYDEAVFCLQGRSQKEKECEKIC